MGISDVEAMTIAAAAVATHVTARPGAVFTLLTGARVRRGHCPSQHVTAGAPLPGPRLCRRLESGDAHGPVLWPHL
jgi:hypothetical protein